MNRKLTTISHVLGVCVQNHMALYSGHIKKLSSSPSKISITRMHYISLSLVFRFTDATGDWITKI